MFIGVVFALTASNLIIKQNIGGDSEFFLNYWWFLSWPRPTKPLFPTEYWEIARIHEYKGLAWEKCARGQQFRQAKPLSRLKPKKAAVETWQQWRKHEQVCSLLIRDVTQ